MSEFLTDDRVVIRNTGSELDGERGTILGLAVDHVTQTWIVGLDEPHVDASGGLWRAITMPSACLSRTADPASRFVPGSDPIASNATNQSGPVASDRPVPPSCFHPEIVNTLHGSACLRCGDEVEGVPV